MNFLFIMEPDPENCAVRFHYYLPEPENVQFEVYNLNGMRVARISDGLLPAGVHSVFWSTDELSDGAYLVRFSVRDESIVQKVELMV